jgi:diguanylate cyclase (GGDEF)-like protein
VERVCLCEQNCEKLLEIQKQIDSYQKCVENSLQEISNLNIKYEKTVNELSSIINIFEYINLITDYKNLFPIINDMLIGILGVISSTILSFCDNEFTVEASSVSRQQLTNMDLVVRKFIDNRNHIFETCILDESMLQDEFSLQRGIKSAVLVPLTSKNSLMGLIYLEHVIENYFEADDIRYLNTLSIAIRLSLENAQLYSKLEETAMRDGLTGLYNRMFFNKEIQNCLSNYNRLELPFVLSIVDIDNFKRVNDNYGHLCGDLVLKEVASLIKNHIRKEDIVCRYGGEEFAILFKNTEDIKSVLERVNELRLKIKDTDFLYEDNRINVTCSFGLVTCTSCSKTSTIEEIVKHADEALYEAKRTGRNKVCMHK